jgi:hypothetical protein
VGEDGDACAARPVFVVEQVAAGGRLRPEQSQEPGRYLGGEYLLRLARPAEVAEALGEGHGLREGARMRAPRGEVRGQRELSLRGRNALTDPDQLARFRVR